jgi:uncharacterized membrane protein YeaQ/YmgE (transglycosylase-associated protein family)
MSWGYAGAVSSLGAVIAIMASAFVTGALARFAIPGPDPMPAWLTISIGLAGSVVGIGVDRATDGHHPAAASFAAFGTAVLLVVAYRRFVQHRPIFGPEALRFPRRGVGVREYRERLARAGVDPDALLDRALEQRRAEEERRRGGSPPPPAAQEDDSTPPPPDKDDQSASGS